MVEKVKKKDKDVLYLTRKQKIWVCTECKKEYNDIPSQCSCGALAPVFDEKEGIVGENEDRKIYKVHRKNILYQGQQVNVGQEVSLIVRDRITKDLLERNLVVEVK